MYRRRRRRREQAIELLHMAQRPLATVYAIFPGTSAHQRAAELLAGAGAAGGGGGGAADLDAPTPIAQQAVHTSIAPPRTSVSTFILALPGGVPMLGAALVQQKQAPGKVRAKRNTVYTLSDSAPGLSETSL